MGRSHITASLMFLANVFVCPAALAQSYTCNKAPCFKANPGGWIVGEIRSFAFGANGADLMTNELSAKGWAECAGQTVPRAPPFDQLFRAIGTTWGSADGQTDFYLPDLRGSFLRAWNHEIAGLQQPTLGGDPDAGGRTEPRPEIPVPGNKGNNGNQVGSIQPDAMQEHTHVLPNKIDVAVMAQLGNQTGGLQGTASDTGSTQGVNSRTSHVNGPPDVPVPAAHKPSLNETRPQNIYVMYAIYVGTPFKVTTVKIGAKTAQKLQAVKAK